MIGKLVDIVIVLIFILCLFKGFRRGLGRELFGIVGAIMAVALAYHSYQELSIHLLNAYPLESWQAQVISFVAIIFGVSLAAALIGFIWWRVIRLTPFAILDRLGGAIFGIFKVCIVVILLVMLISISPGINEMLAGSTVVGQAQIYVPFLHEYLDEHWPQEWYRPLWLFPEESPEPPTI